MRKPVDPKPETEVDRSDNKEFWLEVSRRKPPDSKLGTPIYHKFGRIMGHCRPSDGKTEFFHPVWANLHNGYLAPYYEEEPKPKPKQPMDIDQTIGQPSQLATDPEARISKVEKLTEDGDDFIVGLEPETLLPKRVVFSDPVARAAWLLSGAFKNQLAKELADVLGSMPDQTLVGTENIKLLMDRFGMFDRDVMLAMGRKAAAAIAAQAAYLSANNMDHVDNIEIDLTFPAKPKEAEDVAESGRDDSDGGRAVAGEAAGEVRAVDEDEGDESGDGEGGVPVGEVREERGEVSVGSVQDGGEVREEPEQPAPDSGPDQAPVPGPGRDVSSGGSD